MVYSTTFYWPSGPSDVIVTGTFDNWTQSIPLVKTSKGDFEINMPLKPQHAGDDKILFKFVVDGEWTTSSDYETEDDNGNVNNVIYYANLAAAAEKETGSKIPEAGGLVAASAPTIASKGVDTTVLPSEEGKQVTSGEPGVVIPENAADIKEFSEVSNVNAKDLNEQIKAEEAAEKESEPAKEFSTTVLPSTEGEQNTSATGEPGVVIPENAADIKEFSEVSDVNAKDLNEEIKAEEAAEKKTKSIAVKKTIKRNKLTGEEIVVSSVPIEEAKTLDPKANGAAHVEPATASSAEPVKKAAETKASPVKATPKKATPAKKEEEKKKGGFFRKLKAVLN